MFWWDVSGWEMVLFSPASDRVQVKVGVLHE